MRFRTPADQPLHPSGTTDDLSRQRPSRRDQRQGLQIRDPVNWAAPSARAVPQRTPAAPSWNARMASGTGPRSLPASQTSVPDSWQPAAKGTSSGARSAGAATTPIVHPSPGAGHHRHHQRRPDRSRPPVSNRSSTTVRTTLPSNSSTVRPMTTTDFLDGQARGRASMLVRLHPIGRPESGPARAHVGVVRNPPSAFRKRPGWAG